MTRKTITIKYTELCYYLFFSILFFAKGIGLYDGQMSFKVCLVLAAVPVAVKLLMTDYDRRQLLVSLALLLLGVIVYYRSGEKSALVFLVMMIGFKGISFDRIMKLGLIVWSAAFGLMVLKSILGVGNEVVMAHHKFGLDILREGMGYSHPNVLHVSYAVLVVLILYVITDEKKRIRAYILTLIGNGVVFLYSASYTGFMLVIFLMAFHIYFTYRKDMSVPEKILTQAVFPVCVLFALFAPLLVDPDTPLFSLLNKLLNRRFYASRLYLLENPVTLLGQKIYASHTYALDSSYVTLLIYGGLLLFVLVCAGYLYSIRQALKERNGKALSILLSFSIAGVIEPFLFNFSFKNLSLLVVAGYLFSVCKGGKQVKLFSGYDKAVTITLPVLQPQNGWKESKKVLCAVLAAAVIAAMYAGMVKMPQAIYVEEKYCDIEDKDPYRGKVEEGEDAVFYGVTGETQVLYRFDRETILFERIRDTIRLGFCVYLAVYGGITYFLPKKKR